MASRYSYPIIDDSGQVSSSLVAVATSAKKVAELLRQYADNIYGDAPGSEMRLTLPEDKIEEQLSGSGDKRLTILIAAYTWGERDVEMDVSLTVYKKETNALSF